MTRERYVLLYDGHCNFCKASRDLILRWDRTARIEPLSFQDPGVLEQFPMVSYDQAMSSMHIISPDGRVAGEEEAVRVLVRFSPFYLRWIGAIFYIPGVPALVRSLYRFVARNRYRLMGKNDCDEGACAVHFKKKPTKPT